MYARAIDAYASIFRALFSSTGPNTPTCTYVVRFYGESFTFTWHVQIQVPRGTCDTCSLNFKFYWYYHAFCWCTSRHSITLVKGAHASPIGETCNYRFIIDAWGQHGQNEKLDVPPQLHGTRQRRYQNLGFTLQPQGCSVNSKHFFEVCVFGNCWTVVDRFWKFGLQIWVSYSHFEGFSLSNMRWISDGTLLLPNIIKHTHFMKLCDGNCYITANLTSKTCMHLKFRQCRSSMVACTSQLIEWKLKPFHSILHDLNVYPVGGPHSWMYEIEKSPNLRAAISSSCTTVVPYTVSDLRKQSWACCSRWRWTRWSVNGLLSNFQKCF